MADEARLAEHGEAATAAGGGAPARPARRACGIARRRRRRRSAPGRGAAGGIAEGLARRLRAPPDGGPRRPRPRLHPREPAARLAADQPLVPRRGAKHGQRARGRPGAAGRQPLRRQHDARHAALHARLLHLLRRRAALLPARPQPRARLPLRARSCAGTGPSPPRTRTRSKALEAGAALLVYPGGDWEVHRPSWERNKVDFAGRKGFVRLALDAGVPIVPVVSIGGQETALFLSRGIGSRALLGSTARCA